MEYQKRISCKCCNKTPDELEEYKYLAERYNSSPRDVAMAEEGTYNPRTGKFYCTECYIKVGMPTGKA